MPRVLAHGLRARQRAAGPGDGSLGAETDRQGDRGAHTVQHQPGGDAGAPLVGVGLVLVGRRVVPEGGEEILRRLLGGRRIRHASRRLRLLARHPRLHGVHRHVIGRGRGLVGGRCVRLDGVDRTDHLAALHAAHLLRGRAEPPVEHAVGADRQRGGAVVLRADHPAAAHVGTQRAHIALHPEGGGDGSHAGLVEVGTGGEAPRRRRAVEGRQGAVDDEHEGAVRHHHPVTLRGCGCRPAGA